MDSTTMKMQAKLNAFFATATKADVSALLQRTNYDFYKNIEEPDFYDSDDLCFDLTESEHVHQTAISVSHVSYVRGISHRPIVHIGRGHPAADHQDLALAA